MLKVGITTAIGVSYDLTGTQATSPVLAPEDALVELRAVPSRSDVAVPGRPGVLMGRRNYGPIAQDFTFFLHADDGEQMERVYREFRQGWSPTVPVVWAITADHPLGTFYLDTVLGAELPGVGVDMRRRTSATVTVPVFSRVGLFRSAVHRGRGIVTIRNSGDATVYPRIHHNGSGEVVCPSGARFTLPAAAGVVDMDPERLKLAGAFPEGVPPGMTGVWRVPDGASLDWEYRVANPWA